MSQQRAPQPQPDLKSQLEYLAAELGLQRQFSDDDGAIWDQEPAVYLLTGNGMLEIIEAMRSRLWFVAIKTHAASFAAMFECDEGQRWAITDWYSAKTAPEAVARAAYAALQESAK